MDYRVPPENNSSEQKDSEDDRLLSDSTLPLSTSEQEKERAENLLRKIEKYVGEMIVDEVKDPSTEYTEETAILVASRIGHQLPSCHRSLHRLGIPPKNSLIFSALGKPQILN